MRTKTAIAKILKQEGVEFVSLFPMNPLIDALAAEGIRTLKTRTERMAVNVADGFSRASFGERVGVSVVQFGPGIENAFAGVAHAYADSVPLLVLPGGYPRRRKIAPAFDAVLTYREVTKWVDEINIADRAPSMMRRAFSYLRSGRPGPVMLVLPMDVAEEEFDDSEFDYHSPASAKPSGSPSEVREAVGMLIEAERPVIRAGNGVLYSQACRELLEFAELLQIPVFTTMNGKSAFPEEHPLSLGCGGRTRPDAVAHFLDRSDVIFAIGSSCTNESYTSPIPDGKALIQCTIDERDLNKDYAVACPIVGDARLVLKQMLQEAKQQSGADTGRGESVVEEIAAIKKSWRAAWKPKMTSDEVPINPYRLISDLQKALDESSTIVTHDSGNPRDQMVPFYVSNTPGGYIGWGKSTTLGQSLGLAMGAKLARPDKTVVAVMGDAAFGMVGMDFETAVRESIPIMVVILNNSRLGGYSEKHAIASERYDLNEISGDYTIIARGLGAGFARRVTEPGELVPTLKKAKRSLSSGLPALVEVITREDTTFSNRV